MSDSTIVIICALLVGVLGLTFLWVWLMGRITFQPFLVLQTPVRKQKIFLKDHAPRLMIGRTAKAGLTHDMICVGPKEDEGVSHEHAVIQRDGRSFVISDAGSRNGVFVNGKRVGTKRPLYNKDLIQLTNRTTLLFVDRRDQQLTFPPRPWGVYVFRRFLGGGGMSRIYVGRSKRLKAASGIPTQPMNPIAIKVPRPENFKQNKQILLNEGLITAKLEHEHIVKVIEHGVFPDNNWPFIAMELLCESLRDRMILAEGGRLPEKELREIGGEIAEALSYMHSKRILHCDLKPENILFDKSGRAKIVDFGIAVESGDDAPKFYSYHYASPEHILGMQLDYASDLYMLGCILYEMRCGNLPFEGRQDVVIRKKLESQTPDLPNNLQEHLDLDEVIVRLLSREPADRPASAEHVKRVLVGPVGSR